MATPKLFLPALTFFFFLQQPVAICQPQKLYINPKVAAGANQSKFIDSIRFVPLETNGHPIKSWNSVVVTKNYFVIPEQITNEVKLSIFKKDGKFVKQISLKKYGERTWPFYDEKEEVLKIKARNKNYDLTNKDMLDIKENYAKPSNQKYFKSYFINLNDSAFKVQPAPVTAYDILDAGRYYDDYYYLSSISSDKMYKDSLGYELKILLNNKTVKSFFPYNRQNDTRYRFGEENIILSESDTPFIKYATRPFDYTIYMLDKDSLRPVYDLVVPLENSLPKSFFATDFKTKTEKDNYVQGHNGLIKQVYGFKETSKFIYFQLGYLYYKYEGYLYDKAERKFYRTDKIKGDSTQYNLQLIGNYGLGGESNGKCYITKKASELLEFYRANKNKNIVYPETLQAFFNTATDKSNPVIIEFTFKK